MNAANKVAVLKGGGSLERTVSLRSGARAQHALGRLGYEVVAIDAGPELVTQLHACAPDAAFVALHGRDGEEVRLADFRQSQPWVMRSMISKTHNPRPTHSLRIVSVGITS